MTTSDYVLIALIGAAGSVIIYPILNYIFVRLLNKLLTKVLEENHVDRMNKFYSIHSLRITNNTLSSLKNVTAFVSLDYTAEDISDNREIKTYTSIISCRPLMLSWAKVVENSNHPSIDINQGEVADLNLIRYHLNPTLPHIEIASEQGFFSSKRDNRGRVLLKSNRTYNLSILITADNMVPIRREFHFDHSTATLVQGHISTN